jgi:hypothetical protein
VTTQYTVNAQAGEKAAKVYPWMMCVKVDMASRATSPVIRVTRTNVGNLGEPTFYNDTNRTIKINEMRFLAMPPSNIADSFTPLTYDFDLVRRFGVQIRHTDYDIVRDFLPLYALATHNNVASPILDASLAFSLPTPYLNPNSNAFQMKVRCAALSSSALATQNLGVGLCGHDKHNHPYVLARTVQPTLNGTILGFNENTGGGPVKDLVLEDVNFNVSDIFDNPGVSFLWGLQNEVQFIPPEGPRWHSPTDWFPINGIVNQGNSFIPSASSQLTEVVQQNWVSYKPVTPHIVTPRQQIWIDLKCYQDSSYTTAQSVEVFETPIWVVMLGTQESLA